MDFFKSVPASLPSAGVILFLVLMAMSGWWFVFALGIVGCLLLILAAKR